MWEPSKTPAPAFNFMTTEEQNHYIAKACGYTNIRQSIPWQFWDEQPEIRTIADFNNEVVELPDFCHDLNALYHAETLLFVGNELSIPYYTNLKKLSCIWHASAQQRTAAILKTLSD